MKIAIIGAGFAGLAAGWFLKKLGSRVTFFDKKGIGRGASGVAAGLIHPYVGEQTRPSLWAQDALKEAKALLEAVAKEAILEYGILRLSLEESQADALESYPDVRKLGRHQYLIESGLVVDTARYLQALYAETKAELVLEEITDLDSLKEFDRVLVASGHEVEKLLPQSKKWTAKKKGQLLDVRLKEPTRSTIAKGYLAKSAEQGVYHWGSTYESNYENEDPQQEIAHSLLEKNRFPFTSPPEILQCKAGVRLVRKGHYVPIAMKVEKKVWWLGAFGSRGLLYHAYLGRKMATAMLNDDETMLPKECRCQRT